MISQWDKKKKRENTVLFSLSLALEDNRWTNTMNVARKRLQCKYVQSSRLILAPPSFSFSLSLLLLHLLETRESLRTKLPKKRERGRERKEQANKYRSAVSFKYADLQIDEQEERKRKTHTKTNKKTNVCSHFEDNV